MRISLRAICTVLVAGMAVGSSAMTGRAVGCARFYQEIVDAAPIGFGPLQLDTVYCLELPRGSFAMSPPVPSPDGKGYFTYEGARGLWIGSLAPGTKPQRIVGGLTRESIDYDGVLPFAWASDSGSILGVTQKTAAPSGLSLAPLVAQRFALSGPPQPLPRFQYEAGGLDGILWTGGDGRAVAVLGTGGSDYRPRHSDPHPTIALIDARAGRALQTVELTNLNLPIKARITNLDAGVDRDGRIQALLDFGGNSWFLWIQGQMPRAVTLAVKPGRARLRLSPDGETVLVSHELSGAVTYCEFNPRCPPPVLETGAIAELHNLKDGKVRWRINWTGAGFSPDPPAISPDGRYALINVPAGRDGVKGIALVSMRDGSILDRIKSPSLSYKQATGFGRDSKTLWVSGASRVATYRIND